MTMQKVLSGLIIISTLVFAYLFGAANAYLLAGLTLVVGLSWCVLERNETKSFGTAFFSAFVVLAVVSALLDSSKVFMLVGFATTVAAWDLARFRERTKWESQSNAKTVLETKHLQKLLIAVGSGFLIALVPVFLQFSISFVGFCVIVLIAIVVLRQSLLYLRGVQ